MRRMMLSMSQEKLGDALGLTFQQVQKYEKGTNRIGASRLQQISNILQVPVAFFFEGAPNVTRISAERHRRSPLAGLCVRFSRDLGRPGADQGLHADQEPEAAPPHRRSGRANGGATKTLTRAAADSQPHMRSTWNDWHACVAHGGPHLDRAQGRCKKPCSNRLARPHAAPFRGVRHGVTRQLPVHQRVRFRRPSRQGLRPDFRCHSRRFHRERHQARHRRRQQGEHPARLRDAVHHQQDRRSPARAAARRRCSASTATRRWSIAR